MPAVDNAAAPPSTRGASRRRLLPVSLFLGLLIVYAATATRGPGSIDVKAPAMQAWRIATTGSPWLEAVFHHLPGNAWLQVAPNGHVVADRMAGPTLVSLPLYFLWGGSPAPASFSMIPAGIAAAFLTAATATVLFLALEPRVGARVSLGASLAFAVATPTWSVSADAPWTHTLTQFGVAGAAYGASRHRYWIAGVFLAVGMTGRPHLALVAAVLGVGLSWTERSVRPAVAIGVPSVTALAALACWGKWMFGVWTFSTPGYGGHGAAVLGGHPVVAGLVGFEAHLVNYLGFLVSPDRGLLLWTPVLVALAPAVVRARPVQPAWSVWLAAGGVVYTVAQLQMEEFTGGDWFYGYRYGLELLTCCTPLLTFSWARVGRTGRRVVPVLIAAQVCVIGIGAAVNALFVVDADPWHYNGFLLALREAPAAVGFLLVVCIACGAVLPHIARRRVERSRRHVAG